MNFVLVSVEGQTEETFVREVLRKHLLGLQCQLATCCYYYTQSKTRNEIQRRCINIWTSV